MPVSKSRSSNIRRGEIIKRVINTNDTNDDENKNVFVESILNMIDTKYKDVFFLNYTVKKGYCLKKSYKMTGLY